MVLSSSANLYIKTRMSSMYNCDTVAVLNYYRRNNPHKPTKKTAHFYVFCGLQKLNTLNLRLFHSPSNPRNHFSIVLIETNWYTTSCKYGDCTGLTSITIPNSVTSIDYYAFGGCTGLTEIYSLNPIPPTVYYSCFEYVNKSIPLYVPVNSVDAYKNAEVWEKFGNIKADLPSIYTDSVYDFFGGEDVVVAVKMKNTMEVAGFQTDVEIPYDFSFAKDSDGYPEFYLSDRASRNHSIGTTSMENKKVRVLSYSSTNKTYSGNDGDLFFFKVNTQWDTPIQTYTSRLTNTEFATPDGTRLDIGNSEIKFRCYYIPGDANHDKKVSISDIIAEARHILLQNPEHFHYKSANVNEDEKISVSDIALTANIILFLGDIFRLVGGCGH